MTIQGWSAAIFAFISVAIISSCSSPPRLKGPGVIALRNVTVIDGTGADPKPGQTVVIVGDRLEAIGPLETTVIPEGAAVRDLSGKFVIPGFVDLHVHLPADEPVQEKILARLLEFGVTTILSPGARPGAGIQLQKRIETGKVEGPEMFTAGRIIDHSPTGDGLETWAALVTSEEQIRREVREQADSGVGYIKLYKRLPKDLVAAAIDEAHKQGVKVIGHMGKTTWGEAADGGIDMLVHSGWGTPMDEIVNLKDINNASDEEWYKGYANAVAGTRFKDLAGALKSNKVFVVPTLSITQVSSTGADASMLPRFRVDLAPEADLEDWWSKGWRKRHPQYDPSSEEEAELLRTIYFPAVLKITRAYFESGVTLGVGTDVGNSWMTPGVVYHYELELYQEAGIPPIEILKMATHNGADFLGVLSDIGTLEQGKCADLIVLDADPLKDIRNTQKISAVFHGGKLVERGDN